MLKNAKWSFLHYFYLLKGIAYLKNCTLFCRLYIDLPDLSEFMF